MSFESEEGLEQFVCRFLNQRGALTEKNKQSIEVIMPGDLSVQLETPEHITIDRKADSQPGSDTADRYSMNYGSALLDNIVSTACLRMPLLCCRLKFDYIKTQGFDKLVSRQLAFSGSVGVVQSWGETLTEYLFLTCRYQAQSDELKEGLFNMIFNLETGAAVPAMGTMINVLSRDFSNGTEHSTLGEKKIKKISAWVKKSVAQILAPEIQPFQQSMIRRFRRDIINLKEYYAGLEKEMQKGLLRPGLSKQLKADRKEKIALLPEELERKEADLLNKYSIRIKVHPCAAMLIRTPVVSVMYRASIGRKKRLLSLVYNPCTKAMDPIVCEGCGKSFSSVFFNSQLQMLCYDCQ